MYEFQYDNEKLKYGETAKFCYINIDSFIVYIIREDFYSDSEKHIETRFDTSNYDRPLTKEKHKK